MRKVYYGVFADFWPPSYDDSCDLIGAHIYISRARRAAYATAAGEYYTKEKNESGYVKKTIIDDATFIEKLVARTKYLFTPGRREIIGVRPQKHDPYNTSSPQLGIIVDEDGNRQVDEKYYQEAIERGIAKKDDAMVADAEQKREEARAYTRVLKKTSNH